jgi:hypothetical protein
MESENNFKGFKTSDDEEDKDVIEEESALSCPKLSVTRNHMMLSHI